MEARRRTPRLLVFAAGVIVVAAMYLARDVLVPFALSIVIAFLLAPAVARLQRFGLPRVVAVVTAVLALLACGTFGGWLVVGEARDLATRLPEYRENVRAKTMTLRAAIEAPFREASETMSSLSEPLLSPAEPDTAKRDAAARRDAKPVTILKETPDSLHSLSALADFLTPLATTLATAAMVLLFVILLLLYREDLRDRFIGLVGNGQVFVATQALDDAAGRVSRYLSRQLLLNALLGALVGGSLMVLGVPDSVLWGIAFTVLRFVPYVGVWIAAAPPVLLAFATSDGWAGPATVVGVIVVLELLAYFWLEPWLYAGGTGISPLAILVSTLFWSWLWGPLGLVLATPMTVCLVVLGKYVPQASFLYLLFNDEPALPAPARLYQRLLAQDPDEAWNLVAAERRTRSIEVIEDEVVLPALSLAERDRQQGNLDEANIARICDAAQVLVDELHDTTATEPSSEPPTFPAAGTRVLCMPARSGVDSVGASALARAFTGLGAQSTIAPLSALVGETIERVTRHPFDVVCVSAVPPSRLMHVRYICKRIAKQCPDIEIVVVLWTLDLRTAEVETRVPSGDRIHVVSSLSQARAKVIELAAGARLKNVRAISG